MDPWFITGLIDAEGCFYVQVSKNNNKIGWYVKVVFIIVLHSKDKIVLEYIQNHFKIGNISKQGSQLYQPIVSSVKDLVVIIDHFNKYPLHTQKRGDF